MVFKVGTGLLGLTFRNNLAKRNIRQFVARERLLHIFPVPGAAVQPVLPLSLA
jgi:hypothetical protein